MDLTDYKVVNTHDHYISGWTILSRLLHVNIPHIGDMNGYGQSDLSTLALKKI